MESDLAQLLRRKFGDARFALVEDVGLIKRSQVLEFGDRFP